MNQAGDKYFDIYFTLGLNGPALHQTATDIKLVLKKSNIEAEEEFIRLTRTQIENITVNDTDLKITINFVKDEDVSSNMNIVRESEYIKKSLNVLKESLQDYSKSVSNNLQQNLDRQMGYFFDCNLKSFDKVFVIGYVRDEGNENMNKPTDTTITTCVTPTTTKSQMDLRKFLNTYLDNIETYHKGTYETLNFLSDIRPEVKQQNCPATTTGGSIISRPLPPPIRTKVSPTITTNKHQQQHGGGDDNTYQSPLSETHTNTINLREEAVANMALSQANQLSERAFETAMDGGGIFDQTTLDTDRALFIATTFVFSMVMIQLNKYMVEKGYLTSNKTAVGFNILLFSTMTMIYTSLLGMDSIGPFYVVMYLMMFAVINLGLRVHFDLENRDKKEETEKNGKGAIVVPSSLEMNDKNMEKITLLTWSIASVGAILL